MINRTLNKDNLQAAFSLLLESEPKKVHSLGLIDQTSAEKLHDVKHAGNKDNELINILAGNIIDQLEVKTLGDQNGGLKNKIQNLAESYRDNPKKIKEINSAMLSYSKYTQSVIMMEHKFGEQGTFRYIADSEDDYMQELQAADRHRRDCHNTIVSYTLMLNNAAKAKDLPPIHNGMAIDRAAIGDLAFAIQKEFFEERKWTPYSPSLEHALATNKTTYADTVLEIVPTQDIKETCMDR